MSRPALNPRQRAELDARQRSRILVGLAASIGEKGYAASTIADIARLGRVSKSTLYAHFNDKDEIFLALYSAASDRMIAVIASSAAQARERGADWREQVRSALGAYLEAMAGGGDLTRCLVVEAPAVGRRALALRCEVLERYVDAIHVLAVRAAEQAEGIPVPSRSLIHSLLGGVNEHMLQALAADEPAAWVRAQAAVGELLTAVAAGLGA